MDQSKRFAMIFKCLSSLIDEGIMNDEIRDILKEAYARVLDAKKLHKETVEKILTEKYC